MILADKIVKLRKEKGWSQEELAEKMDVSRQAVSKWESGQAYPDIEKILSLAKLFEVSTDYLLKDELGDTERADKENADDVRRVSLKEANTYIELRKKASWRIALATLLCILSPIPLLILGSISSIYPQHMSETVAAAIGLSALFVFVVAAIPFYIYCGIKHDEYRFLDKKSQFELTSDAEKEIRNKIKDFQRTYIVNNILGTCFCVLSPVPLIVSSFTEKELLIAVMLCVTIAVVSVGVFVFINVGVRNSSMQRLLKEGEFAPKGQNTIQDAVGSIYWSVIVAAYFLWSFGFNAWHISWILFPVGGAIYHALVSIIKLRSDRTDKNKDN